MRQFRIHYVHHGQTWSDTWPCVSNDSCPACGGEIEPWASERLMPNGEVYKTLLHVEETFIPEDGWPEGVSTIEDLKSSVLLEETADFDAR